MSIRSAASWCHPLQLMLRPRGALTFLGPLIMAFQFFSYYRERILAYRLFCIEIGYLAAAAMRKTLKITREGN
jgi:hypothetical protein